MSVSILTILVTLFSAIGISTLEHVEHSARTIIISVDASSHPGRFNEEHLDTRSDDAAGFVGLSESPRPRMMRRQIIGDSADSESTALITPMEHTMKYNTSGRFICAEEGRDCCCKGEVRLGKRNNGSVDEWTSWKDSELWVTCDTKALGDLYGQEKGRYCECNGRCPLTCEPPHEITSAVENIHPTTPCAEDNHVYIPGQPCTLQCLDGFRPTFQSLTCNVDRWTNGNYAWSPRAFACEGLPCAAPTWVENAEDPPCHQGLHILHGGSCGPRCKPGYEPSETHLYCEKGSLSPMGFHCKARGCGISEGWIEHESGDGACKEGEVVRSGENCTAQCQEGYRPSLEHLSCSHGVFFPAEFICHEAPCAVPVGVPNSNDTFPCSELWSPLTSSSIPSGKACSPQCMEGFEPDIEEMNCSLGRLSPPVFACKEIPCQAPSNISHGPDLVCKEGDSIEHNFACTTQCDDGFEPTVASLNCRHGILSPSTFECKPASCDAPSVEHAPEITCRNRDDGHIPHAESCMPLCDSGWEPSEPYLSCWSGKLSPANFTCAERPCSAPAQVEHGLGCPSDGGATIDHGKTCTPACAEGYEPSVDSLVCIRGGLQPANFTCAPKPCTLPTDVEHAAHTICTGDASISDQPGLLSAGFNCTPQCSEGFFATETALSCNVGALTPPTFECGPPRSCVADSESMFIHSVGTHSHSPCWEGAVIEHGQQCHVQCGSGYTASVETLSCDNGRFTPSKVECKANHQHGSIARCLAPVGITHQQYIPCDYDRVSFADGEECVTRCANSYSPSVRKLTCREGAFDPPTFECTAS